MNCYLCGKPVDTNPTSGNYKHVQGWVQLRYKGANEVALREDLGSFMHRDCMHRMKAGVHPNQKKLL